MPNTPQPQSNPNAQPKKAPFDQNQKPSKDAPSSKPGSKDANNDPSKKKMSDGNCGC